MAYDNKKLKQNEFNEIVPQAYSPAIDDYEAVQSTHGGLHNVLYGPNGLPLSVVNNKLAVRATELEALMQGFSTDGKLEQVRQEIENSKNELALVKSELESIKSNQLSGDQKVQLSGTIVSMQVGLTRSVRQDSFHTATLSPPTNVKGVLVVLDVYGVTGTFSSEQEGYRLDVFQGIRNSARYFGVNTTPRTTPQSGAAVFWYPGVTGQGGEINGNMECKHVNSIFYPTAFSEPRIRLRIDGTFNPGEGIDCEMKIYWLV